MSEKEAKAECEKLGATSASGKIYHCWLSITSPHPVFRGWSRRDTRMENSKGTLAPGAAGVIHGDFEKGSSAVRSWLSLTYTNSDQNEVRANGKYMQKGKTYEVQDADVIFWKFN